MVDGRRLFLAISKRFLTLLIAPTGVYIGVFYVKQAFKSSHLHLGPSVQIVPLVALN